MAWEAPEQAAAGTARDAAAQRAPPPLEIRFFGGPEARVGGVPIPALRTRAGWWTLALLALRVGRPVERSWLAGTLWPESSETLAFANLRRCLNDLRHALGDQAHRLHSPSSRLLSLDLAGATVDLLSFDEAIHLGDENSLKRAVALHRGPLLEGCAEEWVLPERETREQAYLRTLESLAAAAIDRRSPCEAQGYLRRLLVADPLRESAVRSLMEALAQHGDYAALTQTYRDFRLLLHQELNAQPDAETAALYHSLRAEAREKAQALPPTLAPSAPSMRRLPAPTTPFIGREAEIEAVLALLAPLAQSGGARKADRRTAQDAEGSGFPRYAPCAVRHAHLVTLTGTGGVGKTRLAIAVAEEIATEYRDGACFVDLAPVQDPARVVQAAALSLELREDPNRPLLETLLDHLQARSLLLILDNCEHLAGACASLAQALLARCPQLQLLTTSRQPLGIPGERAWRVPSFAFPEGSEKGWEQEKEAPAVLMGSEAVRFFVERATSAHPAFRLTRENLIRAAEICRLLDGIPLALELASPWVRVMPIEQLVPRLRERLDLLQSRQPGTLARHQTLRATLDWSYDLLDEGQQRLLRHLSVFAGGWTLEAAEAVCADSTGVWVGIHEVGAGCVGEETGSRTLIHPYTHTPIHSDEVLLSLAGLVDRSLVIYEERRGRYRLLETTRQYAGERIAPEERRTAERRHAAYFLAVAEAAVPALCGPDQRHWLERLEGDHDNFRRVLHAAREAEPISGDGRFLGLRLSAALGAFWARRGHLAEGRAWLTQLLSSSASPPPGRDRCPALLSLGRIALLQYDLDTAATHYNAARDLAEEAEDRHCLAMALHGLGNVAHERNDNERAAELQRQSLAICRQLNDPLGVAMALGGLGNVEKDLGDYGAARRFYDESLSLHRQIGNHHEAAVRLFCCGLIAMWEGDREGAASCMEESLKLHRELEDPAAVQESLIHLSVARRDQGDLATARALLEESLTLADQLGGGERTVDSLLHLAWVACRQGRLAEARDCVERGAAFVRSSSSHDTRLLIWLLSVAAQIAGQAEQLARVARLCGATEAQCAAAGLVGRAATAPYEAVAAAARATLAPEDFAAAWAEGGAMSQSEAIGYALAWE
jgi:predicted ATPase/DNA-binding SARP family transcriptional activator